MASGQRIHDRQIIARPRSLALAASVAILSGLLLAGAPAHAQSIGMNPFQQAVASDPNARMLLEADELIYDIDNDTVSASGSVDIYYRGYTIETDRVDYDQRSGRVFARGNVKLTQPDGNVIYADEVELTDDFRDGFVTELTLVTTEDARFAARSAERFDDNVTVFNQGVYTACAPCEEDPSRAPFWQIKARKIIHNEQEQTVYYEDASFELFGMPIAYLPYFSHPDPTVKQRSGFLRPTSVYDADLGFGVKIPYYFALAPDYDLTVAVTPYTKQGPLGSFQWRQRFEKGSYDIVGAGIHQLDPDTFLLYNKGILNPFQPVDAEVTNRGALQTRGLFEINSFWKWGWQGTLMSDETFMRTYNLTNDLETRDQLYLTGQSARNWFDARILHYQIFSNQWQFNDHAQPFIHPVVDYNYIFGEPVLGGQLSFDTNFYSLNRTDAEFATYDPRAQIVDPNDPSKLIANPDYCPFGTANNLNRFVGLNPNQINNTISRINPQNCNLIGAPGTSTRLVLETNWERTLVHETGQIFRPFASVRGDVYAVDVDDPFVSAGLSNAQVLGQFLPEGENSYLRGMAAVGLEYRYPILVTGDWGYQVFEPIGQIYARPDAQHNADIPNNDALSFVFDDTNLFEVDKFSGYDRMDGGTRANVGIKYTAHTNNGMQVGAVFGQSYHLAGENPYPVGSGLETDASDFVTALYFSPISSLQIVNRLRLDDADLSTKRYDLEVAGVVGMLQSSLIYSNIAADPQQGILDDREEIQGLGTLRINPNWKVWAGGRYEISGSQSSGSDRTSPQWISTSFGFGYEDECVTIAIGYERQYVRDQELLPDERIMFQFALRTLTEGRFRTTVASDPSR